MADRRDAEQGIRHEGVLLSLRGTEVYLPANGLVLGGRDGRLVLSVNNSFAPVEHPTTEQSRLVDIRLPSR